VWIASWRLGATHSAFYGIGPRNVYVWICMYICTSIYLCIYICIYICVYIYAYRDIDVSIYIYLFTYSCIYTHIHTYTFIYIYVYISVGMHTYTIMCVCHASEIRSRDCWRPTHRPMFSICCCVYYKGALQRYVTCIGFFFTRTNEMHSQRSLMYMRSRVSNYEAHYTPQRTF